MTGQIRGMDQARRNANDGISMAQTAEGALSSSGDILQRIRELAVQSSNASNSGTDRQALQAEVGQLTAELDRIAQTTEFNGQKLMDGTSGTLTYQVGANANQTISATGSNFRTSNYGNNSITGTTPAVAAFTNGSAPANPIATGATIAINGSLGSYTTKTTTQNTTAQGLASEINSHTSETGVTASAKTEANMKLATGTSYVLSLTSDNPSTSPVTISFSMGASNSSAGDYAEAISAINAQSGKSGVTAEYDSTNGGIKLTNQNGNNITLASGTAGAVTVDTYLDTGALAGTQQASAAAGDTTTIAGRLTLNSDKSFSVADGTAVLANASNSSLQSVSGLDVSSFNNAQKAIQIVDSALQAINSQRAQFGALQSRFENTISNLQVSSENLSASRSRIQDADFASETAKLTKSQVLQQAGTAMLAQANQLPQGVLSLLR